MFTYEFQRKRVIKTELKIFYQLIINNHNSKPIVMKKLTFILALVAAATFAFTPVTVETYTVDAGASTITWEAKKVTGKHDGTVTLKSGNLEYTDGFLSGGEFVVDMTSITVTDLKGNMAAKLEGHLKSPDFFDVENHTDATFKITSSVSRGTKGEYKIKGDLTVKVSLSL